MYQSEAKSAMAEASEIYQQLREKYKGMKTYLGLMFKGDQTSFVSDMRIVDMKTVRKEAEKFVTNDDNFEKLKKLEGIRAGLIKRLEKTNEMIDTVISKLELEEEIEVCIYWDQIDYEINKKLRCDPLIDLKRTPQKGGIKIVIGTLEELLDKREQRQLRRKHGLDKEESSDPEKN